MVSDDEYKNSRRVISKIIELTLKFNKISYDFDLLDLDREDMIIFKNFANPNYSYVSDPKYFEKGLRVLNRIENKINDYLEKKKNG